MKEKKLDRRRQYYMILDCETATLPFVREMDEDARKQIAIAKPLIYDFAWKVVDRRGNTYLRRSYLISEIFSVPHIFNTAYYAEKRPIYLEKLRKGEIVLTDWQTASEQFEKDLEQVSAVGAYNSMFDYKKAIPFTELYIKKLYSPDYFEWENQQRKFCEKILTGNKKSNREFEPNLFRYRNKEFPLFDIWGMACEHLLNCDEFRSMCDDNGWQTASGKYYSTTAETAYRFLKKNYDFEESHTAIEDVDIETEIFAHIVKDRLSNLTIGITYFPFRIVGRADW